MTLYFSQGAPPPPEKVPPDSIHVIHLHKTLSHAHRDTLFTKAITKPIASGVS